MTTASDHKVATAWVIWVILAALLVVVTVSVVGSSSFFASLADFLPVLGPTRDQLAAVAMAFGLCVSVILVATGVLVAYTTSDRIFRPSALRWVDVLVGAFATATVFVVVALLFIPGPPQLYMFVVACVPAGVAMTMVLLVMRSLLRRAVTMHLELDEVV